MIEEFALKLNATLHLQNKPEPTKLARIRGYAIGIDHRVHGYKTYEECLYLELDKCKLFYQPWQCRGPWIYSLLTLCQFKKLQLYQCKHNTLVRTVFSIS